MSSDVLVQAKTVGASAAKRIAKHSSVEAILRIRLTFKDGEMADCMRLSFLFYQKMAD
jgi:hypothetical protein